MSTLRILLACVVLGFAVAQPAAAKADFDSVGGLLRLCKTGDADPIHYAFCGAYVEGVADMMSVMGVDNTGANKAFAICGTTISTGAMVQAFVNWAEKHPERWADDKRFGVAFALRELWPCK